jgi:hypothetical protein
VATALGTSSASFRSRHLAGTLPVIEPTAAFRALALRGTHGDTSFALDDPDDTSVYLTPQSYGDDVINVYQESTYAFVARLMDEVSSMYREAGGPLRTWQVGSGEVPEGAWVHSPACAALIASGAEYAAARPDPQRPHWAQRGGTVSPVQPRARKRTSQPQTC